MKLQRWLATVFLVAAAGSGAFSQQVPKPKPADYAPPPYVNRDAFEEKEVKVGKGDWVLPGTLTAPKQGGPFPAVVLVQGSGPHDRDETIGPNKPFRDLAWGLASRGLAVLRYEKRTKAHSLKMAVLKELTVKEEVIDDAVGAAALLRQTENIDAQNVFVLGHSLGGMLIPRIGEQDRALAGLISLAGNTRPMEELLLEQVPYVLSLNKGLSEETKQKVMAGLKQQIARLHDPKLSSDVPAKELPLNVPAAYWLSLRGYSPPAVAATLAQPMLILQGERDYQVTMEDFAGWKKGLAARKNITYKCYPRLNHLFIEGEGKSKPAEYAVGGHVAQEVVDDIAAWIKKR